MTLLLRSFFSNIIPQTYVLSDGSFFIADRNLNKLFRLSESGELLSSELSEGRGPREVMDIGFLSRSVDGTMVVYDLTNSKVIHLDSLGIYLNEFLVSPWNSLNIREIYPVNENDYIMYYPSFEFLYDDERSPEAHLVLFNRAQENYLPVTSIKLKPLAKFELRGAVIGGMVVPYSSEDLRAYDFHSGDFYLYRSDSDNVMKLTSQLDTTDTIPITIKPESVSRTEIDSLRETVIIPSQWKYMEEFLPSMKAKADHMMIDQDSNIWLKLNHTSDYQRWLVVSDEGENKAVVNLPKDIVLTHVSSSHLGVRLNGGTFALYEPYTP